MIPYRVYYSQKRIRFCVVKKVDLPIKKIHLKPLNKRGTESFF